MLLLASLLSACETTAPVGPAEPSQPVETSATATALMQRAARLPADRAAALYLQAAWAYLESPVVEPVDPQSAPIGADTAGPDYAGAQRAHALIEPGWLDAQLLPDYQLLSAALLLQEGMLNEGALAQAREALARVPFEYRRTPRALRISSALCEADGDFSCAVRDRVAAAGDDPAENERIWQLLNQSLSLTSERGLARSQPGLQHLAGWLELQKAVVLPFSRAASRDAVNAWLNEHPEHPAALIPPAAVTSLLTGDATPTRVALLLPLSGPLARAGESVRDGFIAASLSADASGWLTLSVYDSAAEPLPVLYERILADGADLLIGPLQKPAVTELSALNPDLPVLALNYLDDDAPAPAAEFNQFGLAIEDEARTIARRLQADQVSRALLFHNYDDWSLRARRTLSDQANGNGLELTVQPFTDLRTITESVGSAMHVAGSQSRRDELAQLLGEELEFLPRAREDVDAVIALIDNTEANALVPALRFHFANHLPIYASSQTTRRARPGSLSELSGFHVSELPYFLAGDPVYATLARPFGLADNPFASLIALGSDAFRLAERLEPGGGLLLLGSTGLLRQQDDGRISRELAWGTISAGRVQGSALSAAGADD